MPRERPIETPMLCVRVADTSLARELHGVGIATTLGSEVELHRTQPAVHYALAADPLLILEQIILMICPPAASLPTPKHHDHPTAAYTFLRTSRTKALHADS